MSTLDAVAGAALDVWRIRVRGGVALAFVMVHSTLNGDTLRSTERDMGYFFGLGGYLLQSKRLKVGIEARTMLILNANIGFVSLGATVAGGVLNWWPCPNRSERRGRSPPGHGEREARGVPAD